MFIRVALSACLAFLLAFSAPAFAQPAGGYKTTRLIVAPVRGADADLSPVLKEALRARIEEALAATKVFTIETRLEGEADLLFKEGAYIQKAAQKVDLIVFPELDAFTSNREARPISRMEGKFSVEFKGDATMRVRVVSAKTGVLRTSFSLKETVSSGASVMDESEVVAAGLKVGSSYSRSYLKAADREFLDLADKLSATLAEKVYDDAYPPQIIKVMPDRVFISRGVRGGFKVGDTLNVYNTTGEVLKHPVTGEVLDVVSIKIGQVRISEARDDYSVGELVDVKGEVKEGALVRR